MLIFSVFLTFVHRSVCLLHRHCQTWRAVEVCLLCLTCSSFLFILLTFICSLVHPQRQLRVCRRRHQGRKEGSRPRQRGNETDCKLSDRDIDRLKLKGCDLYESLAFGYTHISFLNNSRYLGLRKSRAQRHKILRDGTVLEPKTKSQQFMAISKGDMEERITSHKLCQA